MPKNSFRGRGNPRRVVQSQGEEAPGNGKHFYNHDTRNLTGKFRGKPGRIEKHRRNVDPSRLKQMIEQDVDMGGVGGSSAVEPRIDTRRRGPYSRLERRGQPTRTVHLTTGEGEWRRIAINQGSRFEKEFILKTLMNACKVPFVPIYYHIEGKNAVFFVEDAAAAEALQSLSNQITLQEGFKLILHVRNGRPHNIPVGEQLREKMKLVMSRRYDAASKVLNLSKFYSDEEICIDYYAPLSRENVLHAVVKIISDNIPDVECIDLSGNKLHNLDALKNLKEKATGLKSLNLCNNKISQITSLDNIEGLPLRNLVLNQNPVCDRYTDQASYISAVRKRFPKLTHLDGVELGPVISFDIEADDVVIPPSRGGWYASPESQAIVFRFLEQYFMLYDSDDRQSLIDAYHDSAILSLTCSHSPGQQADRASRLDAYMKESRNLRRIESSSQRFYLLKKGKVDIVSFLSKLPKTTHDPRSLVVDVPVASSALIQVSMTGIFKERSERHPTLRWFQRVMVIIPNANGFCITNEQIHVTNATPDQAQNAFKDVPAAAPPAVPVPGVQPSLVETVQDSSIEAIRRQMVLSFSEQSGMNLEYSSRCLEDNDWDFNRAASVFGQLRTENKIPPEAFVRPLTTV